MEPNLSKIKYFSLIIITSIIWGTAFILIKLSLKYFSSFEIASYRMILPILVFLPIFIVSIKKFTLKQRVVLFFLGLINNLIPYLLYAIAQEKISSSTAGIITSLTPIFTLIIGVLFFDSKIKRNRVYGIIIGFIGVLLILSQSFGDFSNNLLPKLYIVVATILYAISNNIIKYFFNDANPFYMTAHMFLSIAIPLLIFNSITSTPQLMINYNIESILPLFLLGIIVTGLGTLLFIKTAQLTDTVSSSLIFYLVPVVSIMIGFIYGEMITFLDVFGFLILVFGVYLVSKQTHRK